MSLDSLKAETLRLRKEKSPLASFAVMVLSTVNGKAKTRDPANPVATDDDAIVVIKKARGSSEEMLALVPEGSDEWTRAKEEIAFLDALLPAAVSNEDVKAAAIELLENVADKKKAMGVVMTQLTEKFGANLDRKSASQFVKELIS